MPRSRRVAFLKGINVGGRRVKMEQLRESVESLGFSRVATFIASGNVIFDAGSEDSASLESLIEHCLHEALGFEADAFVRSGAEIRAITALDPFADEMGADDQMHVVLLKAPASDRVMGALRGLGEEGDRFKSVGREIYWLRRGSPGSFALTIKQIAQALGPTTNTMRNLNTIHRIRAKFFQ